MADNVTKRLTIAVGASDTSRGVLENLERRLDRIKTRFGPRGFLKDVTELAVGGGAIAGVTFLTRVLAQAAGKAEEISTAFREGRKSVSEMLQELLLATPILGNIAQAGKSIREIITGHDSRENAFAAVQLRAATAQDAATAAILRNMQDQQQAGGALAALRTNEDRMRRLREADPGFARAQEMLRQSRQVGREGVIGAAQKEIDEMLARLNDPALRGDSESRKRLERDIKKRVELVEIDRDRLLRDFDRTTDRLLAEAFANFVTEAAGNFGGMMRGVGRNVGGWLGRRIDELRRGVGGGGDVGGEPDWHRARFAEAQDERFTSGIGASMRESESARTAQEWAQWRNQQKQASVRQEQQVQKVIDVLTWIQSKVESTGEALP